MELIKCILGRLGCNLMKIGCMFRMRWHPSKQGCKVKSAKFIFLFKGSRPFSLGRRGSRNGAVLVLNGQMSWCVILILELYWFQKGAIEVDYLIFHTKLIFSQNPRTFLMNHWKIRLVCTHFNEFLMLIHNVSNNLKLASL